MMDKSWIKKPRNSAEYITGLNGFLDFAFEHNFSLNTIICPCDKCGFNKRLTRDEVLDHLLCKPFPDGYTFWYRHGETREKESDVRTPIIEDGPHNEDPIDRLTMLDLSSNQLYGKIPIGTQLQSFNASSFEGNLNLCGEPLDKKCSEEEPMEHQKPPVLAGDNNSEFSEALYMSLGLGFFTGFCGFIGTISILPSWRDSLGRFLNALIIKICMCWKQ